MQINQRISDDHAVLTLIGRFDFNTHSDFRKGYESVLAQPGIRTLEIDMGRVEYLDSSALGMLLLLKELAEARNVAVRLARAGGTVRQILEIANFNKLFTIT